MLQDMQRTSRNYVVVQILLLFAFALVYFLDVGPRFSIAAVTGILGAVFCALGISLMLLALASLGRSLHIEPKPKVGAKLVTRGVYGHLRHPIYTALVLLVVGLFLRRPTLALAIMAVVIVAFLVAKARFEEELLLARYPEYAEYRRRTWGIIPWLGRYPSD